MPTSEPPPWLPDFPIETHPWMLIATCAFITDEEASRYYPDAVIRRIR